MNIHIIPVLQDNYAYILESGGQAAVIDPGEAGPVMEFLEGRKLNLTNILNTHHHGDHIAGNGALQEKYGARIYAPDDPRIPDIDFILREKDRIEFGGDYAEIFETPGHTKTHICFYFPESGALFTGDTLFSMGCGRLFEGTPAQMWRSFQKILALPDSTNIYCGHEYTIPNGRFCLRVEPDNADIQKRLHEAEELRSRGLPTLPVTLATEKKTNVFLRAGSPEALGNVRERKNVS